MIEAIVRQDVEADSKVQSIRFMLASTGICLVLE